MIQGNNMNLQGMGGQIGQMAQPTLNAPPLGEGGGGQSALLQLLLQLLQGGGGAPDPIPTPEGRAGGGNGGQPPPGQPADKRRPHSVGGEEAPGAPGGFQGEFAPEAFQAGGRRHPQAALFGGFASPLHRLAAIQAGSGLYGSGTGGFGEGMGPVGGFGGGGGGFF